MGLNKNKYYLFTKKVLRNIKNTNIYLIGIPLFFYTYIFVNACNIEWKKYKRRNKKWKKEYIKKTIVSGSSKQLKSNHALNKLIKFQNKSIVENNSNSKKQLFNKQNDIDIILFKSRFKNQRSKNKFLNKKKSINNNFRSDFIQNSNSKQSKKSISITKPKYHNDSSKKLIPLNENQFKNQQICLKNISSDIKMDTKKDKISSMKNNKYSLNNNIENLKTKSNVMFEFRDNDIDLSLSDNDYNSDFTNDTESIVSDFSGFDNQNEKIILNKSNERIKTLISTITLSKRNTIENQNRAKLIYLKSHCIDKNLLKFTVKYSKKKDLYFIEKENFLNPYTKLSNDILFDYFKIQNFKPSSIKLNILITIFYKKEVLGSIIWCYDHSLNPSWKLGIGRYDNMVNKINHILE